MGGKSILVVNTLPRHYEIFHEGSYRVPGLLDNCVVSPTHSLLSVS